MLLRSSWGSRHVWMVELEHLFIIRISDVSIFRIKTFVQIQWRIIKISYLKNTAASGELHLIVSLISLDSAASQSKPLQDELSYFVSCDRIVYARSKTRKLASEPSFPASHVNTYARSYRAETRNADRQYSSSLLFLGCDDRQDRSDELFVTRLLSCDVSTDVLGIIVEADWKEASNNNFVSADTICRRHKRMKALN